MRQLQQQHMEITTNSLTYQWLQDQPVVLRGLWKDGKILIISQFLLTINQAQGVNWAILNSNLNNDSVWEVQGDNDDQIVEEVPSEGKLRRIGERQGSLNGSGLDFSQRDKDFPVKKNLVSTFV